MAASGHAYRKAEAKAGYTGRHSGSHGYGTHGGPSENQKINHFSKVGGNLNGAVDSYAKHWSTTSRGTTPVVSLVFMAAGDESVACVQAHNATAAITGDILADRFSLATACTATGRVAYTVDVKGEAQSEVAHAFQEVLAELGMFLGCALPLDASKGVVDAARKKARGTVAEVAAVKEA